MEEQPKKEIYTALNKAIDSLKIIAKNAEGYSKFRYANLAQIVKAISEPLTKNGLFITHSVHCEEDKYFVVSTLCHTSGESLTSEIPLLMPKKDMQGLGAAISYARRYNVMCLLNLGISDKADDDGESLKESEVLSDDQIVELKLIINGFPDAETKLLSWLGFKELRDIPLSQFNKAKKGLEGLVKKMEAKDE